MDPDLLEDADLYSDASSVMSSRHSSSKKSRSSQSSRSTARSSKNRRKQAAKRFSLKEGGVHEEEALLHELKRLIEQVHACRQDTRATLLVAIGFGAIRVALSAQDRLSTALGFINEAVPKIWPPPAFDETSMEPESEDGAPKVLAPLLTEVKWELCI